MTFNDTVGKNLIDGYLSRMSLAAPDYTNYSTLNGILQYEEGRSIYYYTKKGVPLYNVEIYDFNYVGLIMRVSIFY